ncbi:MAG: hypothetical protein JNK79_16650 [Chitinophagaceae bacterium]|nr:hypothetical protein [Chitinophagaceae bacterium]
MLRKIKKDKWKHFFVGIPMGVVLQLAGHWLFPGSDIMAIVSALLAVIAISFGFELFSLFSGLGHYDFYDAIASIIGGIIGMAIGFWAQCEFGLLNIVIQFIS